MLVFGSQSDLAIELLKNLCRGSGRIQTTAYFESTVESGYVICHIYLWRNILFKILTKMWLYYTFRLLYESYPIFIAMNIQVRLYLTFLASFLWKCWGCNREPHTFQANTIPLTWYACLGTMKLFNSQKIICKWIQKVDSFPCLQLSFAT